MIVRVLISVVLTYVIPFVLILMFSATHESEIIMPSETDQAAVLEQPDVIEESEEIDIGHIVILQTAQGLKELSLESYILGVVLAEMPAEFESEALKAQAVVARTYTCRMAKNFKHEKAQVCTDSACCQAYMSESEYLSGGGAIASVEKVKNAVKATEGKVLLYQGELIEATYFSCSGGRTEDARAVWGTDVPYLQSVDSPGEEIATHYTDTVTFSITDFCQKLGVSLSEGNRSIFGTVVYTEGGGVATIVIANKSFTGTQVRQKLGLRSTAFTASVAGDTVRITTKGFGHRVGMSQYGAEAMAIQGSSYQQILYHYYQGTELTMLSG